ncbi:MAG: hypothetical protein Q4D55_10830 [Eubacteriales bacterium]|nr:hypothetical protein [Eubacteriales bacterium]
MKRMAWKKRILFLLLCVLFAGTAFAPTRTMAAAKSSKKVSVSKKKPFNGWYTFPSGKKRYYRRGKYLTGLKKVHEKTYLFNIRGVRLTGTQKVGRKIYYLNEKGVLQVKKLGNNYYYANGKRLPETEARNFAVMERAREIVAQITNNQMSDSYKLKVCFDWVIRKPYVTRRQFSNFEGWPAVYADDHFLLGGGNCFSDAAAFAYLAKAVGYKNVNVCVDSKGQGGHAWAEVNGLCYDPLFAEAKNYAQYFGTRYGVYPLSAILRIPV